MGRNEAATIATGVLKTPSSQKFLESSGSGWKDASARAPRGARQSRAGVAERDRRCTFATSRRPRFTTRSPWRPDAPGSCSSTGWESRRCACLLAASAPSPGAAGSGDGPLPSCRPFPGLFIGLSLVRRWQLLLGKGLEERREEVSSTWKRGVTSSRGISRGALETFLPFPLSQLVGTASVVSPSTPERRLAHELHLPRQVHVTGAHLQVLKRHRSATRPQSSSLFGDRESPFVFS